MLPPCVPVPWFTAPTATNPRYVFDTTAGRFLLLAFMPDPGEAQDKALSILAALTPHLNDARFAVFGIERVKGQCSSRLDSSVRWFFDEEGAVSRLYGALDDQGLSDPHWLLLDPSLRVLSGGKFDDGERLTRLVAGLPWPSDHAGAALHAPVLIVPRILEPDLCRRLIDIYEADGGAPSGTMHDIGGKTVGVLNDAKRRRDAIIGDESLRNALNSRISVRLLPEIEKAFQFKATRLERYIVACYDAEDGGYFRPHRDNTTLGTAHRKFACTINLNAEEYEGGDLRFPEFGWRSYRAPTGGAVVFSCSLLHEATPVTRGRRYAFLPFLYDEAGRAVRDRNLERMATEAARES